MHMRSIFAAVNVSVCVFPPALLPEVYRYNATPSIMSSRPFGPSFLALVTKVRFLYPCTRLFSWNLNRFYAVGLNFGVQLAWTFISWCTLILFEYIKRHQAIRAHEVEIAGTALESSSDKPDP
jgi:hypothetical protein